MAKITIGYRRNSLKTSEVEFTGTNAEVESFRFIYNNQPLKIDFIRTEGEENDVAAKEFRTSSQVSDGSKRKSPPEGS